MRRDITLLRIDPGGGPVPKGTAVQLNLYATDASGGVALIPGNTSVWSTSDTSVAEVTRQGGLKARALGTLTVTARYADQVAVAVYTVVEGVRSEA